MRRHFNFLKGLLSSADKKKRSQLIRRAHKDEINAASEMVLNVLHKKIKSTRVHAKKLAPHANIMMNMANKGLSIVKRRRLLNSQKVHGMINVLRTIYK